MREHLIIGGTVKGATSSLFDYLSAHPEVCGSSVKETFFFTREYSGRRDVDLARYRRYFAARAGHKVLVEASPNYLGYKESVAPRIKAMLPDARMLFILRNPVDRLYSHYNFARAKLELPQSLAFEDYVDLCERYARAELEPAGSGVAEKHLRALQIGGYADHLKTWLAVFPAQQVKVVFFEHLKRDPPRFMADVCAFAGIDPELYRSYGFDRVNVTFSARLKPLHRAAMSLNRALDPVLRQRPWIKKRAVGVYKRFNQGREGYGPMTEATRARLTGYYAAGNRELGMLLAEQDLPQWVGPPTERRRVSDGR